MDRIVFLSRKCDPAWFSTYGDLLGNRDGVGGEHYFRKTQSEKRKIDQLVLFLSTPFTSLK